MKAYNPTTGWFGKKSVHTVRVTLMQEDYIGHVAYEVYGNCTGADVLDVDYFLETAEKFTENDCEFVDRGLLLGNAAERERRQAAD